MAKQARVKKILVFMATSTPKLIDLARSAQVALRGALSRAWSADPDYKAKNKRVEAHVLVHGYQVEEGSELGSTEYTFTLGDTGVVWDWPTGEVDLNYVPGDVSVLEQWVSTRLGDAGDALDSSLLVIWGHGQGIGNGLVLPQVLAAGVPRAGLVNIGGFGDSQLARSLDRALDKHKLDVLVFDSCLMAGVELAYEFRDVARYLVASQTFVNTAPGGPPGLNVGAAVRAFIAKDAWLTAPPVEKDKQAAQQTDRLLEGATGIVDLIGEMKSGAQQLTLFRLEDLSDEEFEGDDAPTEEWLRQARENPINVLKLSDELQKRLKGPGRIRIAGLIKLFARLLRVGADDGERERVLVAFRRASFTRARQFLDLRDLARQVHQFTRHPALQIVALALINELEPADDGFVVRHRAAVRFEDRSRFNGVSIYCPFFGARIASGPDPTFDVIVDHDSYRDLALSSKTGWPDFVLGQLFEATAAEREPQRKRAAQDPRLTGLQLLAGLFANHCGGYGSGEPSSGTLGGKPGDGTLGGKPGDGTLGGKPADETLGGKPDDGSLGPNGDQA
jgi:hypothetical protein